MHPVPEGRISDGFGGGLIGILVFYLETFNGMERSMFFGDSISGQSGGKRVCIWFLRDGYLVD